MVESWRGSERVIRLLVGRWTLAILGELARKSRRYQDLHTALDGISHKVLTDTLRRAERDGLIVRTVDHNRVETTTVYQLTELARSLGQPLAVLADWGNQNWGEVETARHGWTERSSGR